MKALPGIVVVLVLLLASPQYGSGQVSVGVHTGLSLATVHNADGELGDGLDYRPGFRVGGSVEFPISERLSFQPEFAFAQKGAVDSDDALDLTLETDYIQVPFLLRIQLAIKSDLTPHLLVGPVVGMNTSCKVSWDSEFEIEGEADSGSYDCDEATIELKTMDLGGLVGAGVGFPLGSGEAVVGARYTLGLTSIDDSQAGDDIKNRAFSFLVGYTFQLGG